MALSAEARRAAMEAVLKSRALSRNPRLTALLRYLCERCFRGQTTSIKEYDIATDVFARPADFDQTTDAIVRVEMHRLRKKLKEFYSSEGADQPIEIVIHNGNYIPEFVPREITDSKPDREEQLTRTEPILPSPVKTQIRISRRFIWAISAVVMMALAVVVLAMVARRHATTAPAAHLSPKPLVDAVAALPPEAGYRMLCGSTKGGYRDRQGHEWGPDAFFSGGTAVELPSQPIYRSRDASLFRSLRSGEFSYKIPLRPGTYELRLYFADTSYSPGTAMEGGENVRVFNVLINGLPALRDFDIIADAGPSTGYVRVFKDIHPATDGYLHLGFSKLSELPLINAIEI
ncbi:MAG: malectin, partial [Acidobacteriaceae bacterium]|nr:malectin [Acidobacteriaceae bacterium]